LYWETSGVGVTSPEALELDDEPESVVLEVPDILMKELLFELVSEDLTDMLELVATDELDIESVELPDLLSAALESPDTFEILPVVPGSVLQELIKKESSIVTATEKNTILTCE
jgi:hypothetical protein